MGIPLLRKFPLRRASTVLVKLASVHGIVPSGGCYWAQLPWAYKAHLSLLYHYHRMRFGRARVDIIQKIYKLTKKPDSDCLSAAITVESTPINLNTTRSISMNIRRLATGFADAASDEFLARIIPTYCFGLLHVRLSQAWEDTTNALAEICKTPVGEETIITLAQLWLDGIPDSNKDQPEQKHILDNESDGFQIVSDFECSNFARMSAIALQVFAEPTSGYCSAADQLIVDNTAVTTIAENAREQALRVLAKIISVAEKRSRILVPVLLKWAGNYSFR